MRTSDCVAPATRTFRGVVGGSLSLRAEEAPPVGTRIDSATMARMEAAASTVRLAAARTQPPCSRPPADGPRPPIG